MINNLKYYIFVYYESVKIIILVVGSLVAVRIPVHAGLGVDELIRAASNFLPAFWRLRLSVLLLLIIFVIELHVQTAKWPHWSLRLILIGLVHATVN